MSNRSESQWVNNAPCRTEGLGLSHAEICSELGISTEETTVGQLSTTESVPTEDNGTSVVNAAIDAVEGKSGTQEFYARSDRGGWTFLGLIETGDLEIDIVNKEVTAYVGKNVVRGPISNYYVGRP